MKFYASKIYYISQSIIPVGWACIVIWIMFKQGKDSDIESILVAIAVLVVLMAIFIYALIRQVKTPLVVTDEHRIIVHNVLRVPEEAAWVLVMGLKKVRFLGYKLETPGKNIWLPLGILTKDDRQKLLQEVMDKFEENT